MSCCRDAVPLFVINWWTDGLCMCFWWIFLSACFECLLSVLGSVRMWALSWYPLVTWLCNDLIKENLSNYFYASCSSEPVHVHMKIWIYKIYRKFGTGGTSRGSTTSAQHATNIYPSTAGLAGHTVAQAPLLVRLGFLFDDSTGDHKMV